MCFSRISNISFTSEKNGTHQNRTFDQIRITFDIILSHDTTQWMRSHIDFVSWETMLFLKLFNHIRNIMINKNRFWNIKDKLRSSNPGSIATWRSCILDSLSNRLISLWITLHAMDPNNCYWCSLLRTLWRVQNKLFCFYSLFWK